MASSTSSVARLTPQNARGRTFKVTKVSLSGQQGVSVVPRGAVGILESYAADSHKSQVLYWSNGKYVRGTLVAEPQYIELGPLPSKANTEGYPFRCVVSYTNSHGFTLNPLDEGKVVELDESTGKAKVMIPTRGSQGRGWTKVAYLHIGRTRKYGVIGIDSGLRPTLTANPNTSELSSQDYPLTEILFPLLCSIMYQRSSLQWMSTTTHGVLPNRSGALNFSRRMAHGATRAGLQQAFSKTQPWSIRDFMTYGIKIDSKTPGTGLYLRNYWNFRPNTPLHGKEARNYVGKTDRNFGIRDDEHRWSTTNPQDPSYNHGHYAIARQAQNR